MWTVAGITQLKADAKVLGDCTIDDLWRGRLDVELQPLDAVSKQIATVDAKLDALGEADEGIKRLQAACWSRWRGWSTGTTPGRRRSSSGSAGA